MLCRCQFQYGGVADEIDHNVTDAIHGFETAYRSAVGNVDSDPLCPSSSIDRAAGAETK